MPFVKNNQARIHTIGGETPIVLKPGVNEVDADAWKAAKLIQLVKMHLTELKTDDGKTLLEEVKGPSTASAQGGAAPSSMPSAESLSDLKQEDAEAVVAETFDRELLVKWKKSEGRKNVIKAIDEQLEIMKLSESQAGTSDKKK